jgi:hypothetical protein
MTDVGINLAREGMGATGFEAGSAIRRPQRHQTPEATTHLLQHDVHEI